MPKKIQWIMYSFWKIFILPKMSKIMLFLWKNFGQISTLAEGLWNIPCLFWVKNFGPPPLQRNFCLETYLFLQISQSMNLFEESLVYCIDQCPDSQLITSGRLSIPSPTVPRSCSAGWPFCLQGTVGRGGGGGRWGGGEGKEIK